MRKVKKFCEFSCTEVKAQLQSHWLIIPAGSVEQHTANMPLSVDMDISQEAAQALCEENNMILAPPILYGVRSLPNTGGGSDFSGTVFIEAATYMAYVTDILSRYISYCADKILVINGHYENYSFLCEAVELLTADCQCKIIVMNWWDVLDDAFISKATDGLFQGWAFEHAGIVETALECYLKPELVRGIEYEEKNHTYQYLYSRGINAVKSRSGALSSNKGATSHMGKKIFYEIINQIYVMLIILERENDGECETIVRDN